MYKYPIYILVSVVFLSSLFFSGLYYGEKIERLKWEQVHNESLIAYAKTIKEGEEQHDKDQATINSLNVKLGSLPKLHIPSCTDNTSKDSDTGAGALSKRVDEAFGHLQEGVSSLIKQCDQLNIDAIRSNGK